MSKTNLRLKKENWLFPMDLGTQGTTWLLRPWDLFFPDIS